MLVMLVTLAVLNFDKFRISERLKPLNMYDMVVTLAVEKFSWLIMASMATEEQFPLNI